MAWVRARERLEGARVALAALARRILDAYMGLLLSLNQEIEVQVLGSGISSSLERYASRSLIALAAASAVPGIMGYVFFARLLAMPSMRALVASVLLSVTVFFLTLAFIVAAPGLAYRSRGSRLEPRFPLLASSLATRLLSGSTLSGAVLGVAREDLGDIPEFGVEVEYLASAIKAGVPVDRAFEEAARITPSVSLRSLFSALAVASRTGAGVTDIVDAVLREYLFNVETEVDRVTSSLGAYMEMFVTASVMLPIAVGVVGLLLVFQSIPGLNFETIMFVTTFILTPMTAAGILVLSDSAVSRIRL